MDEVPARPADFPDALVRLVPVLFQEVQQLALQAPDVLVEGESGLPAERQRVDHLAVDVKLALVDRRVADPDRRRALVAWQPAGLPLGEPPFTRDPVHDLDVPRIPGDGPAEPFLPLVRLAGEAGPQ